MAGSTKRQRIRHELEKRANNEEITVTEYAAQWVEGGRTLTQLAADVGRSLGVEVHRATLCRVLDLADGGVAERLRSARLIGGHAMLEAAIDITDDASTASREDLQKDLKRAEIRERVAAKWNRAELGAEKAPTVSISISGQHLDALRRRQVTTVLVENGPERAQLTSGDTSTDDAQVVEAEEVS